LMNKEANILITGAAGFIGSCTIQYLNEQGYNNLWLVDDFGVEIKRRNWETKTYKKIIERHSLFNWLLQNEVTLDCVIHLGARTDTTEFDYAVHQKLNVQYSQQIWKFCAAKQIPLIYASSAATYGDGQLGYNDDHEVVNNLQPLNPYGVSKNEFDKWVLKQEQPPPFWAGLKFFNVYGPNEYHKARMASVIYHSFHQIKKTGSVQLFKSYKDNFADGEQLRDFVYVKDVVQVIEWLMENNATIQSGIYNLGTGKARSFYDLVANTFKACGLPVNIEFIAMPADIRDKYQYFTEANMQKLKNAGYTKPFYSLEEGVADYVSNYLLMAKLW
ncbi:MAG: ADP-glyceromanno-heptose 6-epimerase, partial [Chitinophagaceae bacterium]